MELWEILVPTVMDGKPIRTRYHRIWDDKVREISGGLTILSPVKGQWVNQSTLFKERMIPVRIHCSEHDIINIIKFTLVYYKQISVMAYKISEKVLILTEKDF